MSKALRKSRKMKVFAKGQIVIPISLREKYHIEVGDQIEVIPTEEGILLKSESKGDGRKSMTDQLYGIFRQYARGKRTLEKKDIKRATEIGFSERWKSDRPTGH